MAPDYHWLFVRVEMCSWFSSWFGRSGASGRNCYIGICIILEELLVIDYGQFTAERFQDLLYLP